MKINYWRWLAVAKLFGALKKPTRKLYLWVDIWAFRGEALTWKIKHGFPPVWHKASKIS